MNINNLKIVGFLNVFNVINKKIDTKRHKYVLLVRVRNIKIEITNIYAKYLFNIKGVF